MRAEALHVTLVFLGWRGEGEAEVIAAAAFAAATPAPPDPGDRPRLTPGALRPLPPRRPRLFALELEDEGGRAAALQGAASAALEAGGWYRPEARPFWPHLTLARVRRGERRPAPLAGVPPPESPFDTPALTLYRSLLRPQGAHYEPLARLAL